MITSDAAYPDPSLLIVTPVTLPDALAVTSTVNPVPDPLEDVATPVVVPSVYPVPAALIAPKVLTPDAFAFVDAVIF